MDSRSVPSQKEGPWSVVWIMDSMVHLILANDEAFERGGDYD